MIKCVWVFGHDWGEWHRALPGVIYHINHWNGRLLYKERIYTQTRRCKRCRKLDKRILSQSPKPVSI